MVQSEMFELQPERGGPNASQPASRSDNRHESSEAPLPANAAADEDASSMAGSTLSVMAWLHQQQDSTQPDMLTHCPPSKVHHQPGSAHCISACEDVGASNIDRQSIQHGPDHREPAHSRSGTGRAVGADMYSSADRAAQAFAANAAAVAAAAHEHEPDGAASARCCRAPITGTSDQDARCAAELASLSFRANAAAMTAAANASPIAVAETLEGPAEDCSGSVNAAHSSPTAARIPGSPTSADRQQIMNLLQAGMSPRNSSMLASREAELMRAGPAATPAGLSRPLAARNPAAAAAAAALQERSSGVLESNLDARESGTPAITTCDMQQLGHPDADGVSRGSSSMRAIAGTTHTAVSQEHLRLAMNPTGPDTPKPNAQLDQAEASVLLGQASKGLDWDFGRSDHRRQEHRASGSMMDQQASGALDAMELGFVSKAAARSPVQVGSDQPLIASDRRPPSGQPGRVC